MAILKRDSDLSFPEFVLLRASAGSGKTHALSLRFVQFLLSSRLKDTTPSGLGNILAITFTRNAAREMKTRILDWLKECYFEDPRKTEEVLSLVTMSPPLLPSQAETAIETILGRYTDFQVETIDSFMAAIFRASAIDLGISPEFEIVLDSAELTQYALSRLLRRVSPRSEEGREFRRILDLLLANLTKDATFPWDPTVPISETLVSLHKKLAVRNRELEHVDLGREKSELRRKITRAAATLKSRIDGSDLERTSTGHCYKIILPAIDEERFTDLIGASFKSEPVRKPRTKAHERDYRRIVEAWEALESFVDRYRSLYARDFFHPFLLAYEALTGTLDEVKRSLGTVFISDINRQLVRYIDHGIVPDIYFRLGERIAHYLIDEFQDTNRIQWEALLPLIEESLSQKGSLFVVGDVKQAIYGFRDADWRVMEDLDSDSGAGQPSRFPSVEVQVRLLKENRRSGEKIQDFVREIFLRRLPADKLFEEIAGLEPIYSIEQEVIAENRGHGYVEYIELEKNAESPPEKKLLQSLVSELGERGYAWSDIAILTFRNESVVEVSSWLNEISIPFVPFSSLDIRKRKIIGEVLAFLKFLDAPPDDLSFSVFLLGDIFRKVLEREGSGESAESWGRFLFDCRESRSRPLYASFRTAHPALWQRYFEPFFKTVGYYPLYDLATLIFRVFDIYALFSDEEASLTKFLEVINRFEGQGRNDLQTFLDLTESGEGESSDWTIDVPSETPAVRIMSIHKAKGLGFPVVVFLAYGEAFQPSEFYLGEDPERVRILKINEKLAESDAELGRAYREARTRDAVERLNRLYVGLTRAEAELYVVGVKSSRDSYPFGLLGAAAEGLGFVKLDAVRRASSRARPASRPRRRRADSPDALKARLAGSFELPPNRREALDYGNVRRGEIAHRILAGLEYVCAGWEEDISEIIGTMAPRDHEAVLFETTGRAVAAYFRGSPLADFFERREDRRVLREAHFCDAAGAVFRMDRVVVDPQTVTVIDFKTGGGGAAPGRAEWDAEGRDQVEAYVRILKDIFPGKFVLGYLAYLDRNRWEPVG